MKVLVDTTVWSLALRRKPGVLSPVEQDIVREWERLVIARGVILCGPVRFELLSGLPDRMAFDRLRGSLDSYPVEPFLSDDYDEAAWMGILCSRRGIAAAPLDLLLCSLAVRLDVPLYSQDQDFPRYARVLPLRLHRTG